MAGISTGRAGLVQLGDFFFNSQIKGEYDFTSEALIEEYVDHLMTVDFIPIKLINPASCNKSTIQSSDQPLQFQLSSKMKSFPFCEIIELQTKLTSKRLDEIKEKLKFANLAKKSYALGSRSTPERCNTATSTPLNSQQNTYNGHGGILGGNSGMGGVGGGLMWGEFGQPNPPPAIRLGRLGQATRQPTNPPSSLIVSPIVKDKLKLTLSTLTKSPYVIIENCIAQSVSKPFDMLVGEPSSIQSSMQVKMGINFETKNSFELTSANQVLVLAEVMKNCKIAPMISFNSFTPNCSYKVYIYIKKLDALITTRNTFDLYCEDTVHPMGFILLSLMFILMDEVWTDEDIMKIKPYVEECGWKSEQEQSGRKFGNCLKKPNK